MDEFFRIAIEILKAVLPDSDFGKLLALLLSCFFVLIIVGRLKLEWLGHDIRHIFAGSAENFVTSTSTSKLV